MHFFQWLIVIFYRFFQFARCLGKKSSVDALLDMETEHKRITSMVFWLLYALSLAYM